MRSAMRSLPYNSKISDCVANRIYSCTSKAESLRTKVDSVDNTDPFGRSDYGKLGQPGAWGEVPQILSLA